MLSPDCPIGNHPDPPIGVLTVMTVFLGRFHFIYFEARSYSEACLKYKQYHTNEKKVGFSYDGPL